MKTRLMATSDLEQCSQLFLKVFNSEPWNDQWESVQHVQKYLLEFMNNPVFIGFVIEQNDKMIGASFGHTKSWYAGEEYHIHEYFIDSDLQHSGVGSQLMNDIKRELASRSIHSIVLLTERDLPAEKFYKKHGFEVKQDMIFMYNVFEV